MTEARETPAITNDVTNLLTALLEQVTRIADTLERLTALTEHDRQPGETRIRTPRASAPTPVSTPAWVLDCLRAAPTPAQALADRPDCPVAQTQLYAVLDKLEKDGRIRRPARRGEPYTLL